MSQGRGHGERSCGVLTGLVTSLNTGQSNWHCHGAASNHHSEAEGGSFNSARKRSAWSNVITPNLPNIFSRFHLKMHLLEEAGSQVMSVLLFIYLCYMYVIMLYACFFFFFLSVYTYYWVPWNLWRKGVTKPSFACIVALSSHRAA